MNKKDDKKTKLIQEKCNTVRKEVKHECEWKMEFDKFQLIGLIANK